MSVRIEYLAYAQNRYSLIIATWNSIVTSAAVPVWVLRQTTQVRLPSQVKRGNVR